ncbi:MAG: hypothetical protein ETSY2_49660 [Candidatus Entotheonella gemina]|uniref:Sulfatase-modifying factor enzyme-like domain-containing protein n=1 Tax=Candidatus Entotheonella gemina TaxID=1429439 RepID=W4LB27_9BACT|nr:MAG: hypothetical protein ETSY2_49660 [Candidatus Entotheonella gemina]
MGNHEDNAVTIQKYGNTETNYQDAVLRAVTIPGPFYMMRYPVTNGLFAAFIRARQAEGNPYLTTAELRGNAWVLGGEKWSRVPDACWHHPKGTEYGINLNEMSPVICVALADAVEFAKWLTAKELQMGSAERDGYLYRLPTDAEWEYACRAGSVNTAFWWGDVLDDEHAIHRCGLHPNRTGPEPIEDHSVPGLRRCNAWGLSDMLGNVWEWTGTRYAPGENEDRVVRGGSWGSSSAAGRMLCCFRGRLKPDDRGDRNGFRLVYAPPLA